jgi:hypothetical protein
MTQIIPKLEKKFPCFFFTYLIFIQMVSSDIVKNGLWTKHLLNASSEKSSKTIAANKLRKIFNICHQQHH